MQNLGWVGSLRKNKVFIYFFKYRKYFQKIHLNYLWIWHNTHTHSKIIYPSVCASQHTLQEMDGMFSLQYGEMKLLYTKFKEMQTRMTQKVDEAFRQRDEMKTRMEDAQTSKEAVSIKATVVLMLAREWRGRPFDSFVVCALAGLQYRGAGEDSLRRRNGGTADERRLSARTLGCAQCYLPGAGEQKNKKKLCIDQHPLWRMSLYNPLYLLQQVALNKTNSETLSSASDLLCQTMQDHSSLTKEVGWLNIFEQICAVLHELACCHITPAPHRTLMLESLNWTPVKYTRGCQPVGHGQLFRQKKFNSICAIFVVNFTFI